MFREKIKVIGVIAVLMFLMLSVRIYGDSAISNLPNDSSPTGDDLIVVVDTPATTTTNKKVTITNLATLLESLLNIGIATDDTPQFAGIELGHASDTTITRVSAGQIAVESVNALMNGGALGTPSSGTLTNCTGLPMVGLSDLDPNWLNVMYGENTATDAQKRAWVEDANLATSVNVKLYGATGDGSTDDTTAIQAALTAAASSTGVVFFPEGVYRITDGLTLPEGVSLRGVHVGNKNRQGKSYFERPGATIYFDDNDGDTSPFITLAATQINGGTFLTISDLDFTASANANDSGRHGIYISSSVTGGLGHIIIEHCKFTEMTGYGIYITSAEYTGLPIRISDCLFVGPGGAISISSSTQDYIAWGILVEQCNWEGNTVNTPMDPIWNFNSASCIILRQIVTEGFQYLTGTATSVVHLGAQRNIHIYDWHDEWAAGTGRTDDPNYTFVIGRQGTGEEVASMLSQVFFDGVKTESPIYIDCNDVEVNLRDYWYDAQDTLANAVQFPDSVVNVRVKYDGLSYNDNWDGSQSNAYHSINQILGGAEEPNQVSIKSGTIWGRASYPTLRLPEYHEVYHWTVEKGLLSSYHTRDISAPSIVYGTETMYTDADEGRVVHVTATANKVPKVTWAWDFPDDWGKVPLTYAIRFKPVKTAGSTDGMMTSWSYATGAGASNVQTYIHRERGDAYTITEAEDWQIAVGRAVRAANSGTFGLRVAVHPTSGTVDYYISEVVVLLGDQIPSLKGNVSATTPIRFYGSAAPTAGDWIVGDTVFNSSPSLTASAGWICVSAGAPGTWITLSEGVTQDSDGWGFNTDDPNTTIDVDGDAQVENLIADYSYTVSGRNGASYGSYYISEVITVTDGQSTANSSSNLCPANSWIKCVTVYVVEEDAGTDASVFDVGRTNGGNLDEFIDGVDVTTEGTTANSIADNDGVLTPTDMWNASADTITITLDDNADSVDEGGVDIRVIVFYEAIVEPTS